MRIILSLLFIVVALAGYSQESLYDYASQDDVDFFEDTFLGSTVNEDFSRALKKGEISNNALPLKKIGILSFYIFENEFKKDKALLTYKHTVNGKSIVQTIHDNSIPSLTTSMKNLGITLLTPEQYLLDDMQKEAYNLASQKIQDIVSKKIALQKQLNENNIRNSPEGYNYIGSTIDDGKNQEILNIIADLTKQLTLDGMMTIQIVTQYFNYAIAFNSAGFQLYVPHPQPNEKKEVFGYQLGHYDYISKVPRGFVGVKNDEVIGEDYTAFPLLLERSGVDFINFLQLELNTLFE